MCLELSQPAQCSGMTAVCVASWLNAFITNNREALPHLAWTENRQNVRLDFIVSVDKTVIGFLMEVCDFRLTTTVT